MKELPENPIMLMALYDRSDAMTQRAIVLGLAVERANQEPRQMPWVAMYGFAMVWGIMLGALICFLKVHNG